MKRIYLRRFYKNTRLSLGLMVCDDIDFPIYTLEPPWLHNEINKSCIPTGVYIIEPHLSATKGHCLVVKDVPNRTDILIHVGNYGKDTEGCILVGWSVGITCLTSNTQVFNSKDTLMWLLQKIKNQRELHITDCCI